MITYDQTLYHDCEGHGCGGYYIASVAILAEPATKDLPCLRERRHVAYRIPSALRSSLIILLAKPDYVGVETTLRFYGWRTTEKADDGEFVVSSI